MVAVAVVTEAGILWLVAGFTVWRRRRSREDRGRCRVRVARLRSRLLATRLLPQMGIPWKRTGH
jgi:hypothetical protein